MVGAHHFLIMVSRDYTQELGMEPRSKRVPMPIAFAIIAVLGAVIWYGVAQITAHSPLRNHAEASAPAKPPGK